MLKSGMEISKRRFVMAIMVPALIYLVLWTIIPYIWVLVMSFFEYSPRRSGEYVLGFGGNNPFVGLQHFRDMFFADAEVSKHAREFRIALKNTVVFSFLVLPLNICITLPLAVLVDRVRSKGLNRTYRTLFFLPIVTSSVGVGVMWGYIFNPQRGILNGFLSSVLGRRIAISWLRDPTLVFGGIPVALLAVLFAYLWMDVGYNFIIFLAAIQNIPESLKEAADLDGASPVQKFFRITVPLITPQILLTSMLTIISAFQVFDIIQVMTDGGPNKLTRVLIFDIFENAFRFERMGWASAVAIIFLIVVITISVIQKRLLRSDWEY